MAVDMVSRVVAPIYGLVASPKKAIKPSADNHKLSSGLLIWRPFAPNYGSMRENWMPFFGYHRQCFRNQVGNLVGKLEFTCIYR